MEIVILGKLGLDHRFALGFADSMANTWVWEQGSEAARLPHHPGLFWMLEPLGHVEFM